MSTSIFSRAALAAVALTLLAGSAMAEPSAWWAPYATDSNTLGVWHFDDVAGSTGTFADASGNGNDGTLNDNAGGRGFTLTVPAVSGAGTGPGAGAFGTALDYDETMNDLVIAEGGPTEMPYAWGSVPNDEGQLNYTNAVTLEAWIKPTTDDLTRNETYVAGSTIGVTGFNFGIQLGTLFVDTRTTGGVYKYAQQVSPTLVADTWAHVAAVLSNDGTTSTGTVYVNGEQVATASWADTALGPASSILNIGANGTNPKYIMLRSQLDEVRLSNVAREFGPAPAGLPGDYNHNNIVDAADYVVWRNGDSPDSTQAGYDLWKINFGRTNGSGAAAISTSQSAVPEPATAILLQIVGLSCCVLRNSRRSRTPR